MFKESEICEVEKRIDVYGGAPAALALCDDE